MAGPDLSFWQARFESGQTPWDRGEPNPQVAAWLDEGLLPVGARIVVPGCGRGHELVSLAEAGLTVIGLDYAPAAVHMARERLALAGLEADVIQADVLRWQPSLRVDLVYEQTCLCALHPDHWRDYADQLSNWIKPGGRLLALFMQARRDSAGHGQIAGPPYHCDIHAMRALFPSSRWLWPPPPYGTQPHSQGWTELAVALERR